MRDSEGALLLEIASTANCAHLPARATRLLNRSRLQQQCPLNNVDSDSSRSAHSIRRSAAASRASTASTSNASPLQRSKYPHNQLQQHHQQQQHHRESFSSSDDLMLYDKSFRNAMIQDVLQFKKQLLRLRRILQEDEDSLMRTETLNPFENDNGQLFASCGLDSKLLDDIDLASLTSSTTDDPIQELTDLRRQVVYLQGQVDDRDRTIRLQRNLIEKLEADKPDLSSVVGTKTEIAKECINTATQTERTRPLSIASEGLSRSKPEYTSYTTHFPAICSDTTTIIQHHQQYPGNNKSANQTRRHTIISTTLTNYNHQLAAVGQLPRRASIAWEKSMPNIYKPVKITLIGDPLKMPQHHGESKHRSTNGTASTLGTLGTNGNGSGNANADDDGFGVSVGRRNRLNYSDRNDLANRNNTSSYEVTIKENGVNHSCHYHSNHSHDLSPQSQHTNGNLNPTVTIV